MPVKKPGTRSAEEVRAMGVAVQANLVQLKVADAKRRGLPPSSHAIAVPAPGFVKHFRETLIPHELIASYPDLHVHLRLREVWGQYCLMLWLFELKGSAERSNLAAAPAGSEMRCGTSLDVKHDEVHALLWRLRFEQRRRGDSDYAETAEFKRDVGYAERIPSEVMGKKAADCSVEELLNGACEYAGMLAALRWTMDDRRMWGEAGIMDVDVKPFPKFE